MKLLIIEDEHKLAKLLKNGLEKEGYEVDLAFDGLQGLNKALGNSHDAIILDLMLPGLNGFSVLDKITSTNKEVAILLLTARNELQDRINGLDLGADDFITKPFEFEELAARLRAVLRRKSPADSTKLYLGDIMLDTVSHVAQRNGRSIQLTGKEYDLLEILMRSQNKILTRIEISQAVWGEGANNSSNIIDVYVKRLRSKLELNTGGPEIQSIRGLGYRFVEANFSDSESSKMKAM